MASKFTELEIDCADPVALARFGCAWSSTTRCRTIPTVSSPSAPRWYPYARTPRPRATHTDLRASPRAQNHQEQTPPRPHPNRPRTTEEVHRVLALGAHPADVGQGNQPWVVLSDPEGNEFCMLANRHP